MKNAVWRGRLMMLSVGCMMLLTASGCRGLSDQQLSTILQSVITTGLGAFVSALISAAVGGT